MVDPYHLDEAPLDELAMFATCVHGKNADVQAAKLNRILEALTEAFGCHPLRAVISLDIPDLIDLLKTHGIGQYDRIVRAWDGLAALPRPWTVDSLLTVPGIGPKTARFIVLYAGLDTRRAVLDVHILRWLGRITHTRTRMQTPQSERLYARLERRFIREADRRGLTPKQLDAQIWAEERA